jgi:four helix bundle protein
MPPNGYRNLAVWQKAMTLVTNVYLLTKHFPKEEVYSLTNQIRRAAVSVPSNIAEGKARRSTKDFIRFTTIAGGSLAELETQLLISQNLTYVTHDKIESILRDTDEVGRMLSGLIAKMETANS